MQISNSMLQDAKGHQIYRCCQIMDSVDTAIVYTIGKTRTNTGLKLKFGKKVRVFREVSEVATTEIATTFIILPTGNNFIKK